MNLSSFTLFKRLCRKPLNNSLQQGSTMAFHPLRSNDHSLFTSKTPHFFKIILQETIQDGIIGIPRKFLRKYGDQLSSTVKLEVPSGVVWEVELIQRDGRVLLQKGWPEFAEHHSLELGHFLVFRYEGNDLFHVLIFDKSATEIEYSHSRTEEDSKKKMRTDPADKTGTSSKLRNSFSHSLDDPKGVGMLSVRRNVETNNLCCSQKLSATEKAHAIRIADAIRSTKNPVFMVVMRPSYVGNKYILCIPSDFARKFLTMLNCNLTLCNSAGKTWPAKYRTNPRYKCLNAHLYGGWREFVEDNHLNVGDICVFELTKHPEILMKVLIHPAIENASKACRPLGSTGVGGILASRSLKEEVLRCSPRLTATERARAIEIANAFESTGNPIFMAFMRPSCVGDRYTMCMSSDFAREFLTMHKGSLTLCDSTGKTWPAKYYTNPKFKYLNAQISGGWRAFAEDNHLNVGDICVFELIKHPEILMKVLIFPVVENTSKACMPQAQKSICSRVRSRCSVSNAEPDCQQIRCPSGSREFKDSKLENQKKIVDIKISRNELGGEFEGSGKLDTSGVSGSWGYQKPDHLGKSKMHPSSPTEKRRAADNASWSSSRLVCRKSKEKSHLPCPLPRKKRKTDSPNQPGTNSKLEVLSSDISPDDSECSRINLGNLKKIKKLPGQLDAEKSVKTEAFSWVQRGLTAIDKARAVQIASAFKSTRNPVFIVVMQPSFVCYNYRMSIPLEFSRKFLPVHSCDLTLLNSSGKTWPVKYYSSAKDKFPQALLCGGWTTFVKDNHLHAHDICVFEIIKQHPVILMKVIINPVVEIASKACRPQVHGSVASRVKFRSLVSDTVPNRQQSSCPSNSNKKEDSYIEILVDSPLKQKRKKKLASPSFQPCGSVQAKRIKLEEEKKSVYSQCLREELGGELKFPAEDGSGRLTGARRRCLKPSTSAFRASNPSFSVVMHQSYIRSFNYVHIPEGFAKRYLKKVGEMILRVNGRTWSVEYKRVRNNGCTRTAFRGSSLRPFVKDNELKVGDVCMFELIKENGNFLLEVAFQRKLSVIEID